MDNNQKALGYIQAAQSRAEFDKKNSDDNAKMLGNLAVMLTIGFVFYGIAKLINYIFGTNVYAGEVFVYTIIFGIPTFIVLAFVSVFLLKIIKYHKICKTIGFNGYMNFLCHKIVLKNECIVIWDFLKGKALSSLSKRSESEHIVYPEITFYVIMKELAVDYGYEHALDYSYNNNSNVKIILACILRSLGRFIYWFLLRITIFICIPIFSFYVEDRYSILEINPFLFSIVILISLFILWQFRDRNPVIFIPKKK